MQSRCLEFACCRDVPPSLELYRSKFTKSGRILFEVAVGYSEQRKAYSEQIRIWVSGGPGGGGWRALGLWQRRC